MKTHEVMFFRFRCKSCGHSFDGPLMADMDSYGCFIVKGSGGRYGYLQSIANPPAEKGWETVQALVEKIGGRPVGNDDTDIAIFHRAIGRCLDTVDGHGFSLGEFTCPKCRSQDILYGDSDPAGLREIPVVEFSQFMALDPAARMRHVESFWDEIHQATPYSRAGLTPLARALTRLRELARQNPDCPFRDEIETIHESAEAAARRDTLSMEEADKFYKSLMFCRQSPRSLADYVFNRAKPGAWKDEAKALLAEISACAWRLAHWSDVP